MYQRLSFLSILFLTTCSPKLELSKTINAWISERKGSPPVFSLNGTEYSAKKFREEFLFERKVLAGKYDLPEPKEVMGALEAYAEETVLLNEALAKTDIDSREMNRYLWPFVRRAVISYYLDKESGRLKVLENASDTEIDEALLEKYYAANKELLKEKNPDEIKRKLRNSALSIKIKALLEAAEDRKKVIVGKMRAANRIKLIQKEIYSDDLLKQ
ncbi:hypothetical protein [Leptospira inadai]|nr:hypothetical protein [Leptospira inadai]